MTPRRGGRRGAALPVERRRHMDAAGAADAAPGRPGRRRKTAGRGPWALLRPDFRPPASARTQVAAAGLPVGRCGAARGRHPGSSHAHSGPMTCRERERIMRPSPCRRSGRRRAPRLADAQRAFATSPGPAASRLPGNHGLKDRNPGSHRIRSPRRSQKCRPPPPPDRTAFPARPLMRSLPLSPAGLPRPLARFFRCGHKQLPIAFHDLPCVQGKCRNSPLRRIPAITFRRGRNCCAATIPQILPMHGTDEEPGAWIPIPPAMQIGFPCRPKDASTHGPHPARSSSVRPASSAALIHRGRRPRPDQVSS